jgi:ATP-dependent Clp protease adaptor protein ClpS
MAPNYHSQEKERMDTLNLIEDACTLIIWNDDVNTFDWVIDTLIEICGHSKQQAEQCAMIIHSKGKYAVKNGSYDILKPMCEGIIDRGINATIETFAT